MLPRIITRGNHEAARLLAREGIRQLNILKNLMSFGKLKQDVRRVRFTNGSEITCRSIFGIDDVQIYVPNIVKEEKKKVSPVILVGICTYVHPLISTSAPDVNPYYDFYTYPTKVMLYDVNKDEVIETNMTTEELKEKYHIDLFHIDERTGIISDKGLRLSDDITHEKSYPLTRYLNHTSGFQDDVFVYARGSQATPADIWTADAFVPPDDPDYPPSPNGCGGQDGCVWDQNEYKGINKDSKEVDTKGIDADFTNTFIKEAHILQRDFVFSNTTVSDDIGGCIQGTHPIILQNSISGRADWICEVTTLGPINILRNNYLRFGGTYTLTTRDTYPSMNAGQIGFIQTIYNDYQFQRTWNPGGIAWGGVAPPACPYHNGTTYLFNRDLDFVIGCSFGDLYEVSFKHGDYNYYDCPYEDTKGANGDDFEFVGTQQAFLGIEAGLIQDSVICVVTGIIGSEKIAWPYTGDYQTPGRWDDTKAYKMPKSEKVIAGLNVIPLNKNLNYVDRVLSANDVKYFSLPTGGGFESAVQQLVHEVYGDSNDIFPTICIESRILEKHKEKKNNTTNVWYESPVQPNPWITPKIGESFWRPL